MNSDGEDMDQRIKSMNAVHAVLFILGLSCTAICRADDDDISISCMNVTGTVKKEVTLTCSVSQKRPECCIEKYKFYYTENYKDSAICKQDLHDSCKQSNSFTCRYTPPTAMMRQFSFFVQTMCGMKTTYFTVNITESIEPEIVTEAVPIGESKKLEDTGPEAGARRNGSVVSSVMGCFTILILIIVMAIIYKTKSNYTKPCGFQRRMFLCLRYNEDNSNCPENVINSPESAV